MKSKIQQTLIAVVFLTACSSDQSSDLHPHPDFAFDSDTDYITIYLDELPDWNHFFEFESEILTSLDLTDVSHRVASVAKIRLSDSSFFAVDGRRLMIHQLDYNGQVLSPLAIEGRGPGETVSPVNLQIEDNQLIVMDRVNGVMFFDRDTHTVTDPGFDGVRAVTIPPEDFCLMDENFYILSTFHGTLTSQKGAVFKTDNTFQNTKEYFHRYLYTDPDVNHMMTTGGMLCSKKHGFIAYSAMFGAPVLHMLDLPSGTEIAYHFPDFPPLYFETDNGVGVSDINEDGIYSRFRYNTILDDRFLLHQYTLTDRTSGYEEDRKTTIVSLLFDLEDDMKIYKSTAFPLINETYEDMAVVHARPLELFEVIRYSVSKKVE